MTTNDESSVKTANQSQTKAVSYVLKVYVPGQAETANVDTVTARESSGKEPSDTETVGTKLDASNENGKTIEEDGDPENRIANKVENKVATKIEDKIEDKENDKLELSNRVTRSQVFYDEEIVAYFELTGEDVEVLVDTITIQVEVKVVGLAPSSQNQTRNLNHTPNSPYPQPRDRVHAIFSRTITKEHLVSSTANAAIWSLHIPVNHPRSRLLQPKLVIDSVAKLAAGHDLAFDTSKPTSEQMHGSDTEVSSVRNVAMKSKQFEDLLPIGKANLFEALSFGEPHSTDVVASSAAAGMVTTSTTSTIVQKPLPLTDTVVTPPVVNKVGSRRTSPISSPHLDTDNDVQLASSELVIPVYPALNLRLRCAILSGGGDSENLIASIEITCGETAKVDVLITSVGLELNDGTVYRLGPIQLPQWLRPGENLVLSYSIEGIYGTSGGRATPVTINIDCFPSINGIGKESNSLEPQPSSPHVKTKWDTTVNFENANNSLVPTAVQSPLINNTNSHDTVPIRRAGRPLNRTSSNLSLNSSNAAARTTRPLLTNLTLSFTGPSAVKVGETFEWKVFAVNRAPVTRNLTLFFQSRETPVSSDRMATISTPTSATSKNIQAFPVIDRSVLKRMVGSRTVQDKGIVCLVNDVRIGPLLPQACFEATITILALSPGIHTLGDSTLVDLSNGQGYDCGPLLEVVVSK
ncbi:Uncharacterized protein C14F5.02 [Sugiyamaella lignohabitans]|uniref:Uncharacterized protein C14F5.02 n=1 Tax=Sugiyamaella lignohabitans TaxID=796027 RepID=A0A167DWW1_9ASCO|nr:Uncharacterized protein C14F5.02 [Sugiyamaella lignohabitans]ANB13390.1 Uncharacterized protein C14F5.02 [Sugiyamaella lignohabitans]